MYVWQRDAPTVVPLVRFDLVRWKFVSFRQSMRYTTHISYNQYNAVQNLEKELSQNMLEQCKRVEIIELASMPYLCISKSGSKSFTQAIPFQLPVFLVIPANGKNLFKTNYILTVSKLISSKKISLEAVEVLLALNLSLSLSKSLIFRWAKLCAQDSGIAMGQAKLFPVKILWESGLMLVRCNCKFSCDQCDKFYR